MRFTPLLAILCCAGLAAAQEPKPQPKPGDKTPAKADKKDAVPGRTLKKIEGFTFLFSEESMKADTSALDPKPLAALELECKVLVARLPAKALDMMRKQTIFVDWDDKPADLPPNMVASYFPGTPQQGAKIGRHPLQSNAVSVHSLKTLTLVHQPKYATQERYVLLHEVAHAAHFQLFGIDHAGIKVAYEQARERRLVEKDSYAATDYREYFAEMSCAYLSRLQYYPFNRADLKKHDPVTFKTLETLWGPGKPDATGDKPDLAITFPKDVLLGPHVGGPEVPADKLAGKFVLICYWGPSSGNVLDRLDRVRVELGEYGVVVLGAPGLVTPDEVVKAKSEERAPQVPALRNALVVMGNQGVSLQNGHALLFDPDGKCLYRGSAYDVDEALRAAVGKALLARAVGAEVPDAFKPVANAFAAGTAPVAALSKLAPLTTSTDADVKERALKLQELILAPGQKALAEAQASAKTDPVTAFVTAEQVAARFKGTALATKATTLVTSLRTDKAVAAELKARVLAAEVEKTAAKLRAQEGSVRPSEPKFQTANQKALAQLKVQVDQLRKTYPTARATAEAEKTAREFGVN